MRTQLAFAVILSVVFLGCKKESQASAETIETVPAQTVSEKNCYEFVKGKDTVRLSVVETLKVVNGELEYHWAEKDRNSGTITGKFVGDTLYADYTFNSEGISSVREVAFLKSQNNLIEGFGEVVSTDNKQVFKSPKQLKFEGGIVLTKASCK